MAFETAMKIFEISKGFPKEERYSLTDQIRRSSRSVCANIAEAWRKRIYPAAFVAKISDAEAEAGETQTWLELSLSCNYMKTELFRTLNDAYEKIIGKFVKNEKSTGKMDHILTYRFHPGASSPTPPLTLSPSRWVRER